MKAFKDAQGRSWEIVVNVVTAKRVRDLCGGIDLLTILNPPAVDKEGNPLPLTPEQEETAKVLRDSYTLVMVLWVLCQKQCEEKGVSEEDFGGSLVGDPIEQAQDALVQEVVNFFPLSRRVIYQKIVDKIHDYGKTTTEIALKKLDTIDLQHLTSVTTSPVKSE